MAYQATKNKWKQAKRKAVKSLEKFVENEFDLELLTKCDSVSKTKKFAPTCLTVDLSESLATYHLDSSDQYFTEPSTHFGHKDSKISSVKGSSANFRRPQDFKDKSPVDSDMSDDDSNLKKTLFSEDPKDDNPDSSLKAALIVWALKYKVGRNALTDLLHILREHNHDSLPLSSKTLLKTPRSTVNMIKNIGSGLFWYYGILQCLLPRLKPEYLENLSNGIVEIDIFVDGVSPYKSSKTKLWPICGCLEGSWDIFIIALWCGESKEPSDSHLFFHDFTNEALELKTGFSHQGFQLKLKIKKIIADAPARTWIKNVNQHGSYNACERCTAVGVWFGNRMTYPKETADDRTDESLERQLDEGYHKGSSPLARLGIKQISEIPLEPMHLLFLGVMKRQIVTLVSKKRNHCEYRFSDTLKSKVDSVSEYISTFFPSDFARKPKKWTDYALYKATDYRRIALYDGLLILKTSGVPSKVFENFCLFSCALRILSDPLLVKKFVNDANELLEKFIENSASVYGKTFVVYNVHHLKHLAEECKRHGDLETFSAFKFESHLGVLKRLLHAPGRTLSQIVCRLFEQISNEPLKETSFPESVCVFMPCELPSSLSHLGKGFCKISIRQTRVKLSTESFFLSSEREVVQLLHIIKTKESYLLAGRRFTMHCDYFKYPMDSSALDVYQVNNLGSLQYFTINQVRKKCVVIPIPSQDKMPKSFSESPCLALPMPHGGDEHLGQFL